MIRTAPKAVGIAGREFPLRFRVRDTSSPPDVVCVRWPADLVSPLDDHPLPRQLDRPELRDEIEYEITLRANVTGRGLLALEINQQPFTVPVAVFRPREFFLCMVLSSNYHYGWDPLCYLFGGTEENLELEGDAWEKLRQLEKMYHMRNIPVTWLIDEKVAAKAAPSIARWHLEYGDDYGVMPTSYIHHCAVNYNFTKSPDEVEAFMRKVKSETEARFDFFTTTFAVDQFIGSVGSKFAEAAHCMGLNGLWGVGFDHRTCDTSMYHRGCPWDLYKPHRRNYRIPADHPSTLWMFQWTTRDALLSLHSPDDGPSGAVIFSTDPDDQRISRILYEQPTYWQEFFQGYRENFPKQQSGKSIEDSTDPPLNDVFCFLIHQEDHDCGFPENADLLRGFLKAVHGKATYATMEEITAYLNLKYTPDEHPAQAMLLQDHLRCHDQVVWYANVQKPIDWPTNGRTYPPGIVYYDRDVLWCVNEGESLPWRYFEYRPRLEIAEDQVYPEEDLRSAVQCKITDLRREAGRVHITARVQTDRDRTRVPLVFWHVTKTASHAVPVIREGVMRIRDCAVIHADLDEGDNAIEIEFPD